MAIEAFRVGEIVNHAAEGIIVILKGLLHTSVDISHEVFERHIFGQATAIWQQVQYITDNLL